MCVTYIHAVADEDRLNDWFRLPADLNHRSSHLSVFGSENKKSSNPREEVNRTVLY